MTAAARPGRGPTRRATPGIATSVRTRPSARRRGAETVEKEEEEPEVENFLVICTFLWHDSGCISKFTHEHVNNWARMVRQSITLPHKLVCITDTPEGIDESIEIFPIWAPPDINTRSWGKGRPQCYRRAQLFNPGVSRLLGGTHVVSMDLDLVITKNIDYMFADWPDFRIMRGGSARNAYNGSMWMFKHGARPQIWDRFTPALAMEASKIFMGSDQAWFRYVLGDKESTWGKEHGAWQFITVRKLTMYKTNPPDDMSVVFFAGAKKPWHQDVQHHFPWIRKFWGESDEYTRIRLRAFRGSTPTGRSRKIRPVETFIPNVGQEQIMSLTPLTPKVNDASYDWVRTNPKPPIWCYKDADGWGMVLFIEALNMGMNARMFGSSAQVTENGYVFMRTTQEQDKLYVEKKHAEILHKRGCILIPNLDIIQEYEDKGLQAMRYKGWMPRTIISKTPQEALINSKLFTPPFISKSITGSGSRRVRILQNQAEMSTEIKKAWSSGIELDLGEYQKGYLLWQEFLEGNDYAYRVTKIGEERWVMRIHNRDDVPLASGSGKIEFIETLDSESFDVLEFANKFCEKFRIPWVALDIIRDNEKEQWRLLETSLSWRMSRPESNPACKFIDSGRKATEMWRILLEQIEDGVFLP